MRYPNEAARGESVAAVAATLFATGAVVASREPGTATIAGAPEKGSALDAPIPDKATVHTFLDYSYSRYRPTVRVHYC
jgi:hypothetical protein